MIIFQVPPALLFALIGAGYKTERLPYQGWSCLVSANRGTGSSVCVRCASGVKVHLPLVKGLGVVRSIFFFLPPPALLFALIVTRVCEKFIGLGLGPLTGFLLPPSPSVCPLVPPR